MSGTITTNSLSRASSSYLRSAMRQPIQWHEWGEEAFAAAKRENKPMLLDVGAVWCHWCHVMDRESYDDPEVASIVNENFVAVKVDRDERPDIDSRYQAAVGALTGQGGWPLTAFLMPDGKPFYGGTYFPPQDHYGRPSFKRVLLAIADAFRQKPSDVAEQAEMVTRAISQAESFPGSRTEVTPDLVGAVVRSALKMFDPQNGGFGTAPKFPHPSTIDLLLGSCAENRDAEILNIVTTTLEKMALGGVYDQLAGGFHRYSVDERWIVPHFEKMSYDNSELLKNYVHAYSATGNEFFADVARDIIRWMDEWLSDRQHGGFYASQDADYSMDDDGDYFTWTLEEARAVLTPEESEAAALRYDINEIGEMHHNPAKNVLYVRASVDEIARRMNIGNERVLKLLASARQKMYAARLKRPTPYVDKTVYTGWNAMCVSAYLEAARALSLEDARRFSLRSFDRLLAEGWKAASALGQPGSLKHVLAYSDPNAERRATPGVLDDYAFTVVACLDAYETTGDISYFRFGRDIADTMIDRFFDPEAGAFFDTAKASSASASQPVALGILSAQRKPFQDSPTPAGNPVAAIALMRLHSYTGEASYREKAEKTLAVFAGAAVQHGMFAATYALAAMYSLDPHTQVVVIGEDNLAEQLSRSAQRWFGSNTVVIPLRTSQVVAQNLPPSLAATIPNVPGLKQGRSFALLCSGFTCEAPIFDAVELEQRLKRTKEIAS